MTYKYNQIIFKINIKNRLQRKSDRVIVIFIETTQTNCKTGHIMNIKNIKRYFVSRNNRLTNLSVLLIVVGVCLLMSTNIV